MSTPPRGPRGGRGPRARGGGRGGSSNTSRPRNPDGNESDSSKGPASRGRGRGTSSQNHSRGIAQAFQNATRQQNVPRGGVRAARGGGLRTTTPTPTPIPMQMPNATANGASAFTLNKNTGETPEQRFHRVRDERENGRRNGGKGRYVPGSSLALANASGMVGLCQDMCPEYERARRIFQRDIWPPEKVGTQQDRRYAKTWY